MALLVFVLFIETLILCIVSSVLGEIKGAITINGIFFFLMVFLSFCFIHAPGDMITYVVAPVFIELFGGPVVNGMYLAGCRRDKVVQLRTMLISQFENGKKEKLLELERLRKKLDADRSVYKVLLLIENCSQKGVDFSENEKLCNERACWGQIVSQISKGEEMIECLNEKIEKVKNCDSYREVSKIKKEWRRGL